MCKEIIEIILEFLIIFLHWYIIFIWCVTNYLWCLETLVLRNVHARENFWETFAIFNDFFRNIIRRITVPNLAMFPLNVFNFFPLYEYITWISLGHWVVNGLLVWVYVSYSSYPFCLLVIYDVIRHPVLLWIASLWWNFQHNCSTGVMDCTPTLAPNEIMKDLDLSVQVLVSLSIAFIILNLLIDYSSQSFFYSVH